MMKRLSFIVLAWLTAAWMPPANVIAQQPGSGEAYTVIANPGENAATEIRLNWHTDIGTGDAWITYTLKSDENWDQAVTLRAEQELCTVYDGIYSKRANGEDFHEDVQFLRNTIALKGLQPDTEYMYSFSNEAPTEDVRYFKTASQSGNWHMGIISDIHVYAPLPGRQAAAMAMIRQLEEQHTRPLDMMLHVGDLSAWGVSYSFWPTLYAEEAFRKYVWAGVNGNHDHMTREYGASNEFFRNVNNFPSNGYPGEIGVSYHFTYDNALFIMLNNEHMKTPEELEKAQAWTREVIRDNPATFVIVVAHYQWFIGDDGRSSQYGRWKELFDECGVDLAISGNNHIYVRTNAVYADKETDGSQGTVYIQTPSSDNGRGRTFGDLLHNQDLIRFRWTEGSQTVGALLLNADPKHLTLTLYDRHGQAIDQVSVLAKR